MKKTALQKLIDYMEQNQYFIGNDLYAKQQELLKTEREQIEEAYMKALEDAFTFQKHIGKEPNSEQYYKEMYQ